MTSEDAIGSAGVGLAACTGAEALSWGDMAEGGPGKTERTGLAAGWARSYLDQCICRTGSHSSARLGQAVHVCVMEREREKERE